MAGLTQWLVERRVLRIVMIAVLFALPLLAVVSAAIVVMTTGIRGWKSAAEDCIAALVVLVVLTALAGQIWIGYGVGALLTWLVALMLGQLRNIGSLALAVQVAVLLGALGAVIFMLWSRDPQLYWETVLKDQTERARSLGIDIGPADFVPVAAQFMTGVLSAMAVASSIGALFLGSWWAGRFNGRSFAAEFQSLRMGAILGILAAAVGVLFLIGVRATVDDLLFVLGIGFAVQGLAVIHWHGARRGWPKAWPLALYLPLALVPLLAAIEVLLLTLLGLVDNGYSLRRDRSEVV